MRQLVQNLWPLLTGLVFGASCAVAQPVTAPGSVAASVHSIVEAEHAAGRFDGVVVVLRHGTIENNIALGEADRATRTPVTPGTVFRLASLTKQVTALLVMQEVERGKLRLDDPVRNFVPLAAHSSAVTVQQLLQHVSGLRNPSDGPDNVVPPFYLRTGTGADLQRGAIQFCTGEPKRAPGGNFEYNNCDYLLLGAVLQKVTGTPYEDLVRREVIEPLGLRSWSFAPPGKAHPAALAVGYQENGSPDLPQNPATYGAAGALYGTALDVARWDQALLEHRLLSAASTRQMFQADPKLYGEALGSWSYDLPGTKARVHVVERQGDIGATRCLNLLVPEQELAIVILANTERADLFNTYSQQGLGYKLLQVTTEGAAPPPASGTASGLPSK